MEDRRPPRCSSCHVNTTRDDAIERHKLECNVADLGLDPAGRQRVVLSRSIISTRIIHQTISLSLSLSLSSRKGAAAAAAAAAVATAAT